MVRSRMQPAIPPRSGCWSGPGPILYCSISTCPTAAASTCYSILKPPKHPLSRSWSATSRVIITGGSAEKWEPITFSINQRSSNRSPPLSLLSADSTRTPRPGTPAPLPRVPARPRHTPSPARTPHLAPRPARPHRPKPASCNLARIRLPSCSSSSTNPRQYPVHRIDPILYFPGAFLFVPLLY